MQCHPLTWSDDKSIHINCGSVPCDVIYGTHDDAAVAIFHHGKGTIIYLADDFYHTGVNNYCGYYVEGARYNAPGDNWVPDILPAAVQYAKQVSPCRSP
jgi:hypothetical protein